MTAEEFETEWRAVCGQVERACRYALSDPGLCGDLVQQVAIRAWRGSATFRGDCPFSMWVLKIARNEISRAIRRLQLKRVREIPLEGVPQDSPRLVALAADASPAPGEDFVMEMVERAASAGELTPHEAQCVLQRLQHAQASWDEIGRRLGMSGAHCAVVHCRAIPKLRGFIFAYYGRQIASPAALAEALRTACADTKQPVTVAEAEIFRQVVLEGSRQPMARGSLSPFRAACAKVVRYMSWTVDSAPAFMK